jgi:acid ceramidase
MRVAVAVAALCVLLAVSRASAEEVNCVHGAYPPPSGYALPWATVSLDDDPQHRWDSVVVPRAAAIRDLLNTAMSILPSVLQKDLLDRLHTHLADKVKFMPAPIADELIGIAAASGLDVGEVMLYNIFYEVFSVCTSIVAQDAQGNIHHARNLDFGLFMGYDFHNHSWAVTEKLRPLLVNVEWTQGGKVLFRSTQYAGYVGVLTGMRQNLFAITIDSRFDDKFDRGLINWLDGNHTASWVSLVTRAALVSADTFEEAVQTLSTAPLVAPVYYISTRARARACVCECRWCAVLTGVPRRAQSAV